MGMNVRLELHDSSVNSHKFYELVEIGRKQGKVLARWGRVGTAGDEMVYDVDQAQKKLHEKLRKGYRRVSGSAY
jgi:predicted DNA-binding WGR domain protein